MAEPTTAERAEHYHGVVDEQILELQQLRADVEQLEGEKAEAIQHLGLVLAHGDHTERCRCEHEARAFLTKQEKGEERHG